jgi:hypothetical protein
MSAGYGRRVPTLWEDKPQAPARRRYYLRYLTAENKLKTMGISIFFSSLTIHKHF